jgi:hypothetical protein
LLKEGSHVQSFGEGVLCGGGFAGDDQLCVGWFRELLLEVLLPGRRQVRMLDQLWRQVRHLLLLPEHMLWDLHRQGERLLCAELFWLLPGVQVQELLLRSVLVHLRVVEYVLRREVGWLHLRVLR